LTLRQILKLGDLHSYIQKGPEGRKADKEKRDFEEWSKTVQPGWTPTAQDLSTLIKK
jgi:hypothetical protein